MDSKLTQWGFLSGREVEMGGEDVNPISKGSGYSLESCIFTLITILEQADKESIVNLIAISR